MTQIQPFRIVVVDDHPIFLSGIVGILETDGRFEVVGKSLNAAQAVQLCEELKPDGLLTDVSMKEQSGIDMIHELCNRSLLPPTVVLTVSEDPDVLINALKAGARGYVLKGVPPEELCDILIRVCMGEAYVTPVLANEMLSEFGHPPPTDELESLTSRERGILELLSQGLTNKEIGESLHLAEKTVKHYITKILQKLHLRSRTSAAIKFLKTNT